MSGVIMISSVKKRNFNGIFNSYKMTLSSGKIWDVPLDEVNTDYQEIQKWIADGNSVEEAD